MIYLGLNVQVLTLGSESSQKEGTAARFLPASPPPPGARRFRPVPSGVIAAPLSSPRDDGEGRPVALNPLRGKEGEVVRRAPPSPSPRSRGRLAVAWGLRSTAGLS